MLTYILQRFFYLIPMLVIISILAFIIIELPPGDYLSHYVMSLERQTGSRLSDDEIANLRFSLGLDKPLYVKYLKWTRNMLRGDFGRSLAWEKPVLELLLERIPLTLYITLGTLLFVWLTSIPIGIYSATKQYSFFDYSFTFIGFIGLATPNFLIALVLMYLAFSQLGMSVGGLFSPEYMLAPWSLGKFLNLLNHLWIPVLVIGTAGTAANIRVMRANLLDELKKQYVVTARSKGLKEGGILFKYPVRVALNPMISTIGWTLPLLISGETLTSIVLNIPTTGPVLLRALMEQDMFLAGSFVMVLSALTIIGSLVSDIMLVWLDPRIRFGAKE